MKRIEQEKLKQQQAEDEVVRQRVATEQAEERRKMEIVENNLRRTQLQESALYFAGQWVRKCSFPFPFRTSGRASD